MTKIIYLNGKLSKGHYALVDDEDYERLISVSWRLSESGYAICTRPGTTPKSRITPLMHRVIMNPPSHLEVDHINHNTLDNRKENLRVCTNAQNQANKKHTKTNPLGLRGIYSYGKNGKYRVVIRNHGKREHLGCFSDLDAAIRAYRSRSVELWGDFVYKGDGE